MQDYLQEVLSSARKRTQLIPQGGAWTNACSSGRKATRVQAGTASPSTSRPLHTGIGSLWRGFSPHLARGCLGANGSGAGPASPAPRLRTSVPGHGRCRYWVLELSAGCRSQPLRSTVRAGRPQAAGRGRAAEEAETAIGRRRGGRMASILLRSCRGRGPASLAPPRATSPRGKWPPSTGPVVGGQGPARDTHAPHAPRQHGDDKYPEALCRLDWAASL